MVILSGVIITTQDLDSLIKMQEEVVRVITFPSYTESSKPLFQNWEILNDEQLNNQQTILNSKLYSYATRRSNNNQIFGWGFCDILNNQGRGKCYQPYLGYHKTEYNNCFIIHCFEENNDKHARKEPELIIVIGNHALRVQPTD